jgi:hypothetical protein
MKFAHASKLSYAPQRHKNSINIRQLIWNPFFVIVGLVMGLWLLYLANKD